MTVLMQIYPSQWGNNSELHELYKELIAKDKKEREQYV